MTVKVETIDPWAHMRDDPNTFFNTAPRTKASQNITAREAVRFSWRLFWAALRHVRTNRELTVWLQD